jgi:hypothetical protein
MTARPGAPGTCGDGYRAPSHDDITEIHHCTPSEAEIIAAWFEVPVQPGDPWRLSLHDWRRVRTLARMVTAARTPIPVPRPAVEQLASA